jgi:fatty-acyl-CoA synthase
MRNLTTLNALLADNAVACPNATAATDATAVVTWRELESRVARVAGFLSERGVARHSRVAVWLPNCIDYLTLIFAIARCGAIAIHINSRFGKAEVADLLSRSRALLLITRDEFPTMDFMGSLRQIPAEDLRHLQAIVSTTFPLCQDIGETPVVPLGMGAPIHDQSQPDDLCLTFTTSGTTSKPKLVAHCQHSIALHGWHVATRTDMDQASAFLASAPFCGTYGNVGAMSAVSAAAHIVCVDVFDPERADALIRKHRISHILGDDRTIGRLAEVALSGQGSHDSVKFFAVAQFNPDAAASIANGIRAGLRPCALYGSSELQAVVATARIEEKGYGAVRLVDEDATFILEPVFEGASTAKDGERGILAIKSKTMFIEYLDDPAATAKSKTPDGYFRTGDLATRNGDEFVFEGRLGDVLRLGGFLVNPAEIESHIQLLAGIERAQVVGIEVAGRAGCFAFVTVQAGTVVNEAQVLDHCRQSLAKYKIPVRVAQVENFPTTSGPNGVKISRVRMRQMATDLLSSGD